MGNGFSEPLNFTAPVELRHFDIGRTIGKGAFGKVRMVEHRLTKTSFALKQIRKDYIIEHRCYNNIIRERVLLERLHHPFIVNLRYAFQDDENVMMVFDLMLGGDLRFHLGQMDLFTENMVQFYAAELSSALLYLHHRGVIHRDIKPDNILLDSQGHVHLTDFNCACVIEGGTTIVSETGTQGYMAPEVYGEQGYRESVDWWSLGITMYELLHGERPFGGRTTEELAQLVSFADVLWARECIPELKDFVLSLLKKIPRERLGCGKLGPVAVKKHAIFQSMDWDKMVLRELAPPFIPQTEALNFDVRYELEEILMEDAQLVPKPRRPNRILTREMQIIENEFKLFDYSIYECYTGIIDPFKLSVGQPPAWVKCVDPPVSSTSPASSKTGSAQVLNTPMETTQCPTPDLSALDDENLEPTYVSLLETKSPMPIIGYKLPLGDQTVSPPPSPTKESVSGVTGILSGHHGLGSLNTLQPPGRTHRSPIQHEHNSPISDSF